MVVAYAAVREANLLILSSQNVTDIANERYQRRCRTENVKE